MPTLQQVRDKVNNFLSNTAAPYIQTRQAAYFANNGRYWQGLRTHTGELDYDANTDTDAAGDNLSASPTDQAASWVDALPNLVGTPLPAVFVCDVYESPTGHGYVVTVYVRYNGTIYRRSQNFEGDQSERTRGWEAVIPDEI